MTPDVDFYSICETGLIQLVQSLTTYFPKSWMVGTDSLDINKGADYFMSFRPGKFKRVPVVGQLRISYNNPIQAFEWQSSADLFARYTEYQAALTNFKAVRSAVINLCGATPALRFNSNVTSVAGVNYIDVEAVTELIGVRKPEATKNSMPNYIQQTLLFTVQQTLKFNINPAIQNLVSA